MDVVYIVYCIFNFIRRKRADKQAEIGYRVYVFCGIYRLPVINFFHWISSSKKIRNYLLRYNLHASRIHRLISLVTLRKEAAKLYALNSSLSICTESVIKTINENHDVVDFRLCAFTFKLLFDNITRKSSALSPTTYKTYRLLSVQITIHFNREKLTIELGIINQL